MQARGFLKLPQLWRRREQRKSSKISLLLQMVGLQILEMLLRRLLQERMLTKGVLGAQEQMKHLEILLRLMESVLRNTTDPLLCPKKKDSFRKTGTIKKMTTFFMLKEWRA